MRWWTWIVVLFGLIFVISGCGVMQPKPPASDVKQQSAEQTGIFDGTAPVGPPDELVLGVSQGQEREKSVEEAVPSTPEVHLAAGDAQGKEKPTNKKVAKLGRVVVDYDGTQCRYKEDDEAKDNIRVVAGTIESELLALGASVVADISEVAKITDTIRGKSPDFKVSVCLSLVERGYLPQGVERERQQSASVTVRLVNTEGFLIAVGESRYLFSPISGGQCNTCGLDQQTAFVEAAKLAARRAVEKLP